MDKQSALIIDDDLSISNLLGMLMELMGYECEIANSSKEALSRLAFSNPDLILLDMQLDTALGGQDILFQIRANPRLKDTRVVVITGYPSMADSVASLADFTLIKPIDIEHLKSIIINLSKSELIPRQDYFCDPVTGTYNRDFFHSRIEHAIQRAKRRQDFIFAICVILVTLEKPTQTDLDDPAVFNTVLRDATQSLIHNLRPTDTIARLSHSKFATLHEELKNLENIHVIVKRIQTVLTPPFRAAGRMHRLLFQIGKATSKEDYQSADDLLSLAERNITRYGD